MASLKRLSILGAVTLLTVAAVSVAMAQTGTGGASPMYDVKTETTIKGTVESVDTVTGAGGRGRQAVGGTSVVTRRARPSVVGLRVSSPSPDRVFAVLCHTDSSPSALDAAVATTVARIGGDTIT